MVGSSNSSSSETHAQLQKDAELLGASQSTYRNGISAHVCKTSLHFPAIDKFLACVTQRVAGSVDRRLFLGSVDGELHVSVRLRDAPQAGGSNDDVDGVMLSTSSGKRDKKKKRRLDDSDERAEQTVKGIRAALRRRYDSSKDVSGGGGSAGASQPDAPCRTASAADAAQLELAKSTVAALLSTVKGANGEEVFESCGLSLAPVTTAGGNGGGVAGGERPRLILACRLSAGVALPLVALRTALGPCFVDGMVTTHPESLSESYQLPLSASGMAVEAAGQRSVLLFAAVPHTPTAIASA